jgi:hypothetical protein
MTKIHFVKAAAKAYPAAGVEKGEPYYWWKHFRQGKKVSKTRPKGSQVASSEYERSVLALVEGLEAWEGAWVESDRDDLVRELEEIRDQEQEKYDNMPEGFQQGDTGVLLEERVAAVDEWVSELENITFPEEGEEEEGEEAETPLEQALATAISV